MAADSILQDNLDPFLTTLSWLVGYTIGDDDWAAINNDLLDGGGATCEFAGNHVLKVQACIERKTKFVEVSVEAPKELEPQVELAIAIFRHFHLRKNRV